MWENKKLIERGDFVHLCNMRINGLFEENAAERGTKTLLRKILRDNKKKDVYYPVGGTEERDGVLYMQIYVGDKPITIPAHLTLWLFWCRKIKGKTQSDLLLISHFHKNVFEDKNWENYEILPKRLYGDSLRIKFTKKIQERFDIEY